MLDLSITVLFKWSIPGLFFIYLCSFLTTLYKILTLDFSGIQTRIVRIEGKETDHLFTANVQNRAFKVAVTSLE